MLSHERVIEVIEEYGVRIAPCRHKGYITAVVWINGIRFAVRERGLRDAVSTLLEELGDARPDGCLECRKEA